MNQTVKFRLACVKRSIWLLCSEPFRKISVVVAIESSKLFNRLPAAALRQLRAAATEKSLGDGKLIFKEGDPGDGLYMVKSGTVEISVEVQNGNRQVLSALPPGEIFGEMAVVDEQSRSACASARGNTTVYFVPRGPFHELIRQ